MTWAGLDRLYPVAALGLLAAAVLAASKLSLISAMMTVAYTSCSSPRLPSRSTFR